ncbi:septation regulator SpoVG [Proteiniclasticum sp. QWL-01]|uniref:septation regulator SpoVG n=1 Tax=Proteiniclasticum sp. QWL-01 TaxID=3036945 RepID=UPI0021FE9BD8|nr:septation regulator SpoVG [Proteiniclasticum sp. QWL-01]UUM11202.1 septation regulator SpoVG [Clostridiaceae bacterium HFYG-1003]WFF72541.1 septation regulator SpoVG [Proteiniclasticum sp. QWL-01]
MKITDVRIRKIASEGKMKAIVSVTFENEFVVHDIKVIEGQNGLFIAMPSRKTPDGEFKDIAHPINTETREKLQHAILDEYEKIMSEPSDDEPGFDRLNLPEAEVSVGAPNPYQ